ncbi:MAG: hypothetical protein KKE94_03805 [Gammaproteobacteria bacterium]|nr:hypothetical protein [Gammaproteobacteria bacterium]
MRHAAPVLEALGEKAVKIEARQMFRSNGLIDDLVLYARPEEYIQFAEIAGKAINSKQPELILSESDILIEIICREAEEELSTSLQNKTNIYVSMDDWNARNILRIFGNTNSLIALQAFLIDLAGRGKGYSYISEYSNDCNYSKNSPEWRLHVEIT